MPERERGGEHDTEANLDDIVVHLALVENGEGKLARPLCALANEKEPLLALIFFHQLQLYVRAKTIMKCGIRRTGAVL